MELRNHPLMCYYGRPSWPPNWSPVEQPKYKTLRGEIGVLKRVSYSSMTGYACHLFMEYERRDYIGTILIDDAAFCWQLYSVLQRQTENSLEEIGSLDLSYTL